MPFARCRHCLSLFIVGCDEEAADHNRCPHCGSQLEPAASEEVQQRIEREKQPDPPARGEGAGWSARSGGNLYSRAVPPGA